MKSLQVYQKSIESLGLSRNRKPFNRQTFGIAIASVLVVILLWIFLLCEADSSQEYIESIFVINACTNIFISFASMILIADKLFAYFDGIDKLLDESLKISASKETYHKTNQLVEKICGIAFFALKYVGGAFFIVPKVAVSYFKYFTTDLGNGAFYLPIPIWFPFDWKNPMGYLVAVIILLFCVMSALHYCGCAMFFGFCAVMFAITFVQDLKNQLHSINKLANHRQKMYKKLSKFIGMHANTQQLVASLSDLYEVTLTVFFISFIIDACAALLLAQIEISHDETNLTALIEAAVFGILKVFMLSFVCELGQRVSNAMEIDDFIYHLDWYLFPIKVQRILPTVMQNAQKPSVIKCFGNVLCARTQFRKVVKTTYTYFMVLREFYK